MQCQYVFEQAMFWIWVIPKFADIKIKNTSPGSKYTQQKACVIKINKICFSWWQHLMSILVWYITMGWILQQQQQQQQQQQKCLGMLIGMLFTSLYVSL